MSIKRLEGRSIEEVKKLQSNPIKTCQKTGTLPPIGVIIKTKKKIEPRENCIGFLVKPRYLDARKPDTMGTCMGPVPGTGGEVLWIQHKDDDVAAYMFSELTDI